MTFSLTVLLSSHQPLVCRTLSECLQRGSTSFRVHVTHWPEPALFLARSGPLGLDYTWWEAGRAGGQGLVSWDQSSGGQGALKTLKYY